MNILQKLLITSGKRCARTKHIKYGLILFILLSINCNQIVANEINSIQLGEYIKTNNELRPLLEDNSFATSDTPFNTIENYVYNNSSNGDLSQKSINKTSLEDDNNLNISRISTEIEDDPLLNEVDGNDIMTKIMEKFLLKFADKFLPDESIEIVSGIKFLQVPSNFSDVEETSRSFSIGQSSPIKFFVKRLARFAATHVMSIDVPRAIQTGRLIFFAGLRKIMWPFFIAVQVIKTIMFAMFLPSLLGSLGKIVGKGISSVSGFNHPSETISNLEFKDNSLNFEDDAQKFMMMGAEPEYHYQSDASTNHLSTQMYHPSDITNDNALSRFGVNDHKVSYSNSASPSYASKNSNSDFMPMAQTNNFKVFQNVPASSLLLTNYDPFYSPLLSRLDSVFQQMGQGAGKESCREKLVCLMYSNPAKYAPYSNLVSAQLSRELNELRKPTSDNPDILRFFKYMKAAKDGQDHVDCETTYDSCEEFKESNNPAMITTYNDINKLVEARKLQ